MYKSRFKEHKTETPSYDIISLFYLFSLPQFSLGDNEEKKEKRDF